MDTNHFDVIILGAGPAGLTAGMYLSRAKQKALILNEGTAGGQMILSHEIANYPGVENINGYQLANIMKKQAQSFGSKIRANVRITGLHLEGETKSVEINNKETFTSQAIIISTGGRSKKLGVPGEDKFKGTGISYCATCDGDFFQDKSIIVVGGGNSALEEAVSLTKYANSVTILHQFENFQAFDHAIEMAKQNPKISFIMGSEITEFIGDGSLKKVIIENKKTNEKFGKEVDGVFIFIGYEPNTEMFEGMMELNSRKEIVVRDNLETTVPGVFAAGDSIQKRYRQITTAVADGTIAALGAMEYVNKLKELQHQHV